MAAEDIAANAFVGALFILSITLAVFALRAWRYSDDRRVMLLGLAFLVSAAKTVMLGYGLFRLDDWTLLFIPSLGFDVVMLLLLYFASLR